MENNDAPNPSEQDNDFSIFKHQNINSGFFGIGKKDNENEEDPDNINELAGKVEKLNIGNQKRFEPRDYQIKVFEKAKDKNSIIYMETGKGKTIVSIMLIAHFLGIDINKDQKPKLDKRKKVIFFVCDTALVDQQKKRISSLLNVEVGTIQGKKDKKSKNDYDCFIKKWESLNIFVAIPSIVYKILSCGFIKIFDISMIIFDECHHTADDHAYNKIMTEFYFFYKKVPSIANKYNFPRIYGLTASPIKTGIKGGILESTAYEALQKLSENLDCFIVIDPDMINSNAKEIKIGESIDHYLDEDIYIEVKYHTEIKEYKLIIKTLYFECFIKFMKIAFSSVKINYPEYSNKNYIEKYQEYLRAKFKSQDLNEYNKVNQNYDYLYNLRKFSPFFLIFEKLLRQIFMILENLCLDSLISYFKGLIATYNSLHQRKTEKEENNIFNKSSNSLISQENDDDDDETDVLTLSPESIAELIAIYSNVLEKLKEIKENYISDRLKKLFAKIKDLFNQNNESKFIIFIANRIVAHFLKPALSLFLKNECKNKKCDEIIGINKKKSEGGTTLTPSLTLKKLNEIITNFNEDKFDILIGTSAIEEGLDIQSCNAVLSLVEINTPKSFIQVKGRARKSNSHFYIFTNSAQAAKLKVRDFINMGKKMKELFNGNIVNDFRSKGYISKKPDFIYDMDTTTHSKITWGNVSIFFNEIKQQIESSKGITFQTNIELQKVKSLKGNPEYVYKGIIKLSTNLKNLEDKFPYQTELKNDKDSATKVCQLYLLNVLKKLKYLDSHLKFVKK